jgi:hypothetical protein
MSHTTTYGQIITDIKRFCEVAKKRGHKVRIAENGKTIQVQQYGQNWVSDAVAEVHLKDWRFPLAIKENGEIMYDHWGSKYNTMDYLGETLQAYNQELISSNIPFDQIGNWTTKKVANGDVVITLEY